MSDMEAERVVMELLHKDIICNGDEREILKNEDSRLLFDEKVHNRSLDYCLPYHNGS